MPRLTKNDVDHAVRRLPKKLADMLKANPNKVIIAGGYLRSRITGEKVNDIDLFAPTKAEAYAFALKYTERTSRIDDGTLEGGIALLPQPREIYETDNAYTLIKTWPRIQIIHRWTFEDPVAAIESFDFTIAKAALWFDGARWDSVCHPDYYADLAAKRLVYTSPVRDEEAGGSMLRVLKFYQRGYRIPMESLAAVLARLVKAIDYSKIDTKRPNVEAQLGYVLSGLLREVDPSIEADDTQPAENLQTQETESHE